MMTKTISSMILSAAVLCHGGILNAADAEFLKSMNGSWSGNGSVKVRVNSLPMNIVCTLNSRATDASLTLEGKCAGFLGFSRAIRADMTTNGSTYSGSYVGAGTGTAGLSGKRSGNAIKLAIRWAKPVNGDRSARMTIEKIGSDGMRLITIDTDPRTGKSVVTSQINLRRRS
jgi:hypothetical protein